MLELLDVDASSPNVFWGFLTKVRKDKQVWGNSILFLLLLSVCTVILILVYE